MKENRQSSMISVKIWAGLTASGAIAYALYLVRNTFYLFGLLLIVCLCILVVTLTTFMILHTIRSFYKMHTIDIGPHGTIIQVGATIHSVAPTMQKAEKMMIVDAVQEKPLIDAPIPALLPTVDDLFRSGEIAVGQLVLGFREDGSIRSGSWNDLRTFAVAGVSASGKSNTLLFLVVQALVNLCEVSICDPHETKKRGLVSKLAVLKKYVRVASTHEQIVSCVQDFHDELQRRMEGESYFSPLLLVIDEWTQLAVDKSMISLIVDCVELTARAGAGYDCYVILAGQLWQPSACGGSKIKDSLHAAIVHRLPESQSKHLLDRKHSKLTYELAIGAVFFYDTSGQTEKCRIPVYTDTTALCVAEYLEQCGVPEYNKSVVSSYPPLPAPYESDTMHLEESPVIEEQSTPERVDVVSSSDNELDHAIRAYRQGATSMNKLAQALSCSRHKAAQYWVAMKERGIFDA